MPTQSYSQTGEDLLCNLLLGKRTGVRYIDIGCLWPDEHSNTYFFYLRGGSGLCIDPNPTIAEAYRTLRPRDHFVNSGVSDQPDTLSYHMHRNPVFNTFSVEIADALVKKAEPGNGRERIGVQPVAVKSLMNILNDEGLLESFSTNLDLMSIDTEGYEERVLRGIDFDIIRPRLLVAEFIQRGRAHGATSPYESPIAVHMANYGYRLAAFTGHDLYLMRDP